MEQEQKLCYEVETVRQFTYLGYRVITGGGCEVAETARTNCRWVKLSECGELLYCKSFHVKQKGAVYEIYI